MHALKLKGKTEM